MPKSAIAKLFLVGCPRSGTTLLQSLLAAHPAIISFPESHFFSTLLNFEPRRWRRRLQIVSPEAIARFQGFLAEIGREDLYRYLPRPGLFRYQYAIAFIRILDRLAREQNKQLWLEKTPRHVQFVDYIESLCPSAKFIHLIRNGSDVVASLYETTQAHPEIWQGALEIDDCIDRWCKDVNCSLACLGKPNHRLVAYETLVAQPAAALARICEFINLEYIDSMLRDYKKVSQQVTLPEERWKAKASEDIYQSSGQKFKTLFDEEQKRHILARLAPLSATVATTFGQLEG